MRYLGILDIYAENRWQNNAAAAATTTTTAATATTATCHLKDVTVRLKNESGISLTGKESDFQSVQPFRQKLLHVDVTPIKRPLENDARVSN